MISQIPLLPLMEQFIAETKKGKRRKLNGERILARTIDNYLYTLKNLKAYEEYRQITLCITTNIRNNYRLLIKEKNYWKKFYNDFSDFLFYEKGYYNNYVGSVFKSIKCFFRYLKNEKYLMIQECYERFYVRKENIRIISLLPEQYCFLILDKAFTEQLPLRLKRCKDIFVFGCTAALRYSDLRKLKIKNVEQKCGNYFLVFYTQKTDTPVMVKLPEFAIEIYRRYAGSRTPDAKLFPTIAATNFDKRLKEMGEKAGWVEVTCKERTRNGLREEIKKDNCSYRFCDQLSSHLMRKTGITVLLMLGMQEYVVRKISGHSAHSKEFYRYVNFAQSYITDEIDKTYQKLINLYKC